MQELHFEMPGTSTERYGTGFHTTKRALDLCEDFLVSWRLGGDGRNPRVCVVRAFSRSDQVVIVDIEPSQRSIRVNFELLGINGIPEFQENDEVEVVFCDAYEVVSSESMGIKRARNDEFPSTMHHVSGRREAFMIRMTKDLYIRSLIENGGVGSSGSVEAALESTQAQQDD